MIDLLRVFSFLADHPPQCPPQQIAIHAGKSAPRQRFSRADTFQRCAGTNLQKRHNLHRQAQKSPTGGGLRNFGISNAEGCSQRFKVFSRHLAERVELVGLEYNRLEIEGCPPSRRTKARTRRARDVACALSDVAQRAALAGLVGL